jgi:hypothetical protein
VQVLAVVLLACFGTPPANEKLPVKIDYSERGVQPPPTLGSPQDPTPEKPAEKRTEAPASPGEAYVIVCDSNPSRVIVLDSQGKWISGVRTVEIKFEITQPATLQCLVYEGSIKPTKPPIKTWKLAQLKSVPTAEFQKMIDELQENPDGIRSMLKK